MVEAYRTEGVAFSNVPGGWSALVKPPAKSACLLLAFNYLFNTRANW